MKHSNYNVIVELPDTEKTALYNSRTNALAVLNSEEYSLFSKITSENEENKKLVDELKYGGFIIDNDFNELDAIKYSQFLSRFSNNDLGLTIAPTMGCNFDCVYCYEKNHSDFSKMTDETQDSLFEFVKRYKKQIHHLSVAWYGGEPLLALDVIKSLSDRFILFCKQNDINYNASIITNGFLLDSNTVNILKSCQINFIQVTIDGPKEVHDSRRFLNGGNPTFDRIIDNLSIASGEFETISLRINVNLGKSYQDVKTSISRINELLDIPLENNGNAILTDIGEIQIANLSYKYSSTSISRQIFNDFSYNFKTNNIYLIEGQNGIGKTTLINLLIGIINEDVQGQVKYDNNNINMLDLYEMRKTLISVVQQNMEFPNISVKELISQSVCLNKLDDIGKVIDKYDLGDLYYSKNFNLISSLDKNITDLSGGEKQKIQLLIALLKNSKLIILNEPTSAFDLSSTDIFINKIN